MRKRREISKACTNEKRGMKEMKHHMTEGGKDYMKKVRKGREDCVKKGREGGREGARESESDREKIKNEKDRGYKDDRNFTMSAGATCGGLYDDAGPGPLQRGKYYLKESRKVGGRRCHWG
jgi:hypothetical protein